MTRTVLLALVLGLGFTASAAEAQVLGTFSWQLAPYGSQIVVTVTQNGSTYDLRGVETQCGGNASLPVTGMAVPQANGSILIGLTTINERGRGLHTAAFINTSNFNGTWSDNAGNTNQQFRFNPGTTCPGGPRTDPGTP
ncbi:MAG: hypothetical protein R2712_03150 [Vicinamibacterales bacterium]